MTLADMIDQLIQEADRAALPAWEGAPLHFTIDYWTPDQLEAAFDRYRAEYGNLGCYPRSHMWHRAICGGRLELTDHDLHEFDADLRCDRYRHAPAHVSIVDVPPCECLGSLLTQVICSRCAWHHIGTEAEAIEAWHDHAFPGWRDLPVLPAKLRGKMGATKRTPQLQEWLDANYPPAFRVDGAPILTERPPHGGRHVPGYSPYGGYDISAA